MLTEQQFNGGRVVGAPSECVVDNLDEFLDRRLSEKGQDSRPTFRRRTGIGFAG